MQSSIGQCVALVTYAQAWIRGQTEQLNWEQNVWFAHTENFTFGIGGPENQIVATDPNEWFRALPEHRITSAALFIEPYVEGSDSYTMVAFAGSDRWAPLTTHPDGYDIIWIEKPTFEKRGDSGVWHVYRGGYRLRPEQERIRSSIDEAANELERRLEEIKTFQELHRPDEEGFGLMFEAGLRQLRGRGLSTRSVPPTSGSDEVFERCLTLFPSGANPKAVALVAAVDASWALGGMGWWNDWNPLGPESDLEYRNVTSNYYGALITALAAACEPVN